jgi:hypothetical protein
MVQVMLSIYENYIVDASWPHALPRTMETLDCAGLPSSGLLSAYMSKRNKKIAILMKVRIVLFE